MNFWEEFQKLREKTPRPSLNAINTQNSLYTNFIENAKNCYLVFASAEVEDCYYSVTILNSKNCVDCFHARNCEWCYFCIDSEKCYNCNFLQNCKEVFDSWFCYDCIGCDHCFGCVGLRHKSYMIWNEPVPKEKYNDLVKTELAMKFQAYEKFEILKTKVPRLYSYQINTENCIGDFIVNSKNCYMCFDAKESQDCMYNERPLQVKDCVDSSFLYKNCELSYQCLSGIELVNANYSYLCWYCHDIEYCMYCFNSDNLFGCISLNHKSFHILNQPYSKDAYFKKILEIKEQMKTQGAYGKILESDFPIEDSVVSDYLFSG